MKELVGNAANMLFAQADDGRVIGMMEVIVLLGEPEYASDDQGRIVRQRVVKDVRFVANAAAVREMAAKLSGWADELSAGEARLNAALAGEPRTAETLGDWEGGA